MTNKQEKLVPCFRHYTVGPECWVCKEQKDAAAAAVAKIEKEARWEKRLGKNRHNT
tara:strand:+ start:5873 stop:6040 length:168 start_codon:yes stop_codon:yes gene_type:complete